MKICKEGKGSGSRVEIP